MTKGWGIREIQRNKQRKNKKVASIVSNRFYREIPLIEASLCLNLRSGLLIEIYGVFQEGTLFAVFKLRRRRGELTWGFIWEFASLERALARYPNAIFINRDIEEYGEHCSFFPYLEGDLL